MSEVAPARALAIAAHPDDAEFGCGGTLAKWAAAGAVIDLLVCTDGSKGSWDEKADIAELIAIRQREQRAAASALGARGEVVFLGSPDGELEAGLRQRGEVAYWIRRLRPEVVLGHDPWRRYRLHPDHRNAGFLACDGIVAARDPHFFPEHDVAPWRPATLLLWEADEADHVEDVTDHVEAKLAALEAHTSQFETTMEITDVASDDQRRQFRQRVLDRLAEVGRRAGVRYGEGFRRVDRL
jgi:LmbE family N-acetylglucosaminyl deacetylase